MNTGSDPCDASDRSDVSPGPVSAPVAWAAPSPGVFVQTVLEGLIQSAVSAFLIWIMGDVALTIAGSIAGDMVPSKPPGVHWSKAGAWPLASWTAPFRQHPFLICFALVAIPTTWRNLRLLVRPQPSEEAATAKRATRLSKIGRRLSEGWFTLIVLNAFGAMIGAMIIDCLGNFSVVRIVLEAVFGAVGPQLVAAISFLFGPANGETFGAWLSWYGENQLKFTFWFLYLTAICDDLGIPNFKSTARWCWRRFRARTATPPTGSSSSRGFV